MSKQQQRRKTVFAPDVSVVTEATKMDDNLGVRSRSTVFQLETEGVDTVREQTMTTDSVLRSLTPIINSMRLFGLYFIRRAPVSGGTTADQSQRRVRRYHRWTFARIYATIMLVVAWINAVRYATVFDGQETLGADLFVKLGMIPEALLVIVFQTAYYVASHTGSLNRVLHQVNLSMAEQSRKYSWRAKMITVVCWLIAAFYTLYYVYQVFVSEIVSHMTLTHVSKAQSKYYIYALRAVFVLLQLQFIGSWVFAQAMNFMMMSFLYDQFTRLNEEFSKCVGDRGEFSGNFEQFRQRHQAVSRSVQEADRFLMISNGANVCCHIGIVILVLYCLIFFRYDTISLAPEAAFLYILWLGVSVFGLSLAAGQAVYLNHTESILYL